MKDVRRETRFVVRNVGFMPDEISNPQGGASVSKEKVQRFKEKTKRIRGFKGLRIQV